MSNRRNKAKSVSKEGAEKTLVLRNQKHFYIRYAITQAVVINLILMMWYWWVSPALSATCLFVFELYYLRLILKYNLLPVNFSSFGQGIIVTSLLFMIPLSLLPWYMVKPMGFTLFDLYIIPYEGGFFSQMISAFSITFFVYLLFLNLQILL